MKTPALPFFRRGVAILLFTLGTPLLAVDLRLSDDAMTIGGTNQSTAYGANVALNVAVGGPRRTHLKFDLSSLPSGTLPANVSKATLRLYVNVVTTAGNMDLLLITQDWSETTIKHIAPNLPSTSALPGNPINVPATLADDFIEIDLTDELKA